MQGPWRARFRRGNEPADSVIRCPGSGERRRRRIVLFIRRRHTNLGLGGAKKREREQSTKGTATPLAELNRSELSVRQERAILVGVILPGSTADPRDPLGELGSLAKTAGGPGVGTVLQKRDNPHPRAHVGSGKGGESARAPQKQKGEAGGFG